MKKQRICEIFIICLFVTISLRSFGQQVLYESKIVDKVSNEPLAYVNIVLKGKSTGTFTDEKGAFKIQGDLNDSLLISHIGYVRIIIPITAEGIIKLKTQPSILNEVVVNYSRKREKEKLGFFNQKRNHTMAGVFQYALYIENKNQDYGNISSLHFQVSHSFQREKGDKRNAQVRIRVYEKDSLTGAPGRDLYRKNHIVTVTPKQRNIKVDVSEENIPFLPNGVFIGIDILGFIDESGVLVNYHISDVKKHLSVPLTFISAAPLTYINPNGSTWELYKMFNPNSRRMEIANACFGAEVEY